MTNIWLPLVKAGSPSWAGQPLMEDTCSETDPAQAWLVPAGGAGPLKHVATGLCAAGDAGQPLALTDCALASSWEVRRLEGIVARGSGSGCVSWNAENDLPHAPGNPVIAYACSSPPAWNEMWDAPADGSSGLLRACVWRAAPPLPRAHSKLRP